MVTVPTIRYPSELPITERRDEILAAMAAHQVVIVAGETGSGKSTQLPKMCLERSNGLNGLIGHTQPRRIAARSVAERVADELETTIGGAVGYKVRFTDRVSDKTLIKVMTDGILLAELQQDRQLRQYGTIIVDEAHERSLNVDFLLGYLKQLLPQRPDLSVIITSATINTERFSEHFDNAPVINVSGRMYPVEVRYRPLVDEASDDDPDLVSGVLDAVDELRAEGPGDALVFLSGEREIRDVAEALAGLGDSELDILPLYSRLSMAEQHRVFQPHKGRRIVLATNVAETSLTVPGIRYVIDAGTARISRYNRRTKVQRLPIEAISQASANQRAGRCGRIAPGICVRLYSEDDFEARPAFTDPEILRTNLASVILQMMAIGLGDIAAFPFVDPPDARAIKDGMALLDELGAIRDDERDGPRLTKVGTRLARLPIDPRLGRMVLEAHGNGCLDEVMVITAALSIQDPREWPSAHRQEAAAHHARFDDPSSDFMAYLALWSYLEGQQAARSSNQFRKLCRSEHLNYLRVREWQDLYSQLRQSVRALGLRGKKKATKDAIHRSLLAGLLSHIGHRDEQRREYVGARDARFSVANNSVLTKKTPRWVMAAELVETNRLWARVVAPIRPEWAEQAGAALVHRTYGEPWWDAKRGGAFVEETVTLYGLPLVQGRRVPYRRVDPGAAREMFIWHALVEGDWHGSHAFVEHNRRLIETVMALEDRVRRRDLLVPDEDIFDFYATRIPDSTTSTAEFDRWWRDERARRPALLDMRRSDVLTDAASGIELRSYPDAWPRSDRAFRLTYRYAPGEPDDGVTVDMPLAALATVSPEEFAWHVPGFRHELVTALVGSLPRAIRRRFVPAAETAQAFLATHGPRDGALHETLLRFLASRSGEPMPANPWGADALPDHLRLGFRILDGTGSVVATGRDLGLLRGRLREQIRRVIASAVGVTERTGLAEWDFGTIPQVAEGTMGDEPVRGYPALVDEGDSVGLRLFLTPAEQRNAMWSGTERLLLLTLPPLASGAQRKMPALFADCVRAAVDEQLAHAGGPAWDAESFAALKRDVGRGLSTRVAQLMKTAIELINERSRIESRLARLTAATFDDAAIDIRTQLAGLLNEGFIVDSAGHIDDLRRYVEAIERRLDKLTEEPARDTAFMRRVQRLEDIYADVMDRTPEHLAHRLSEVRWLLEELRVSLFAQSLGTSEPVSEARIERQLEQLRNAVRLSS
jgi:ATP-dependent helicase HrpA